jgi:hypothetical protein
VSTHAPAPEDLAQFGRGLYLEITGPKSGDAPLSKAVKLKDGSVCLYLDPQAKMQLFEQLQRSVLIVSLHEAMAAEKNKPAAVPMQRRRAGQ